MKNKETLHPLVPELVSQLAQGKLNRRDFLRYATLLGVSAAAASSPFTSSPATSPPTRRRYSPRPPPAR